MKKMSYFVGGIFQKNFAYLDGQQNVDFYLIF